MGLYDIDNNKHQIWVFFKNGKPYCMFEYDKNSFQDRDVILFLLDKWDNGGDKLKGTLRNNAIIESSPSYQRMMRRVRGY